MNNKNTKIKEILHSLVDLAIEEDLARMISVFTHEEVYTAIEAIDAKNEKKAEIQASYGQDNDDLYDGAKAFKILQSVHRCLCFTEASALCILTLVRENETYGRVLIKTLYGYIPDTKELSLDLLSATINQLQKI
jgi:hypothetical protein